MVKNFFFKGITLDTLSFTSTTIATPLTPHRGGWLIVTNTCTFKIHVALLNLWSHCIIHTLHWLYYTERQWGRLKLSSLIRDKLWSYSVNFGVHEVQITHRNISKIYVSSVIKVKVSYERNLGLNIIISSRIHTVHLNVFLPRSPICIHPQVVLSKYL